MSCFLFGRWLQISGTSVPLSLESEASPQHPVGCTQIINNEALDYASAIEFHCVDVIQSLPRLNSSLCVNYHRVSAIKEAALVNIRSGKQSKTIAVHVCYNSWNISLPSSAKQQREMTKFWVVRRKRTTTRLIFKTYIPNLTLRSIFNLEIV